MLSTITISTLVDSKGECIGARIRFAYVEKLRVAFRRVFPSARWDARQKFWEVTGRTSVQRAAAFFANERPSSIVRVEKGTLGIDYFIDGKKVDRAGIVVSDEVRGSQERERERSN